MDDLVEGLTIRWSAKQKARMNDLFAKYGQDYSDVGDEIDLETGDIIVNNGHIEGMRHERDTGDQKHARQRRPTAMDRHREKMRSNHRPPIRKLGPDITPTELLLSPAAPPLQLPIPIHRGRKTSPSPHEDEWEDYDGPDVEPDDGTNGAPDEAEGPPTTQLVNVG
jgi:Centromere protein Scm3